MPRAISQFLSGVWSAAPTPLTEQSEVDVESAGCMVEHHVRLGVRGLFLAGSCGEGPWLPDRERSRLVRAVVDASAGRLPVAVQVSDNSAARILENIDRVAADGADLAIISHPAIVLNPTPQRLCDIYIKAIDRSPLPVGIYDLGARRVYSLPEECLAEVYRHPRVVLVKDSSQDARRREIALEARREHGELRLFNGDEFDCVTYLKAGYDGLLLGGAVFNGYVAGLIIRAVSSGDFDAAERWQRRMNAMMAAVYGEGNCCWLSGLKHLLVKMGLFSTSAGFTGFPLTNDCRRSIDAVLKSESELFFPSIGAR